MNAARRRWSGFCLVVVASLLPSVLWGQSATPNPLRQASYTESAPKAMAVAPASATEVTGSPTRRAVPAAIRPTGLELASHPRTGFSPAHSRFGETHMIHSEPGTGVPEPILEGGVIEGDIVNGGLLDGGIMYDGDFMFDGVGKGVKGGADCCGGTGCFQCCIPCPSLDNFEFFAGVQGFTGPLNRGESGSFGFNEGFNWGACFPCSGGELGAQLGARATQSNFSAAAFTDQNRHQVFVTGGLFRRVDWGLQGGVVLDYLHENWYVDANVAQLRGELSWVFPCVHELGFWFASRTESDVQGSDLAGELEPLQEMFEPTELYAFFYRHRFAQVEGAQARFYAGFSGDKDGFIGADARLPMSCNWALECGFAYLVPEEASGPAGQGFVEESWNVAIGLVWYPGARSAYGQDYFRPLFNVADNGSFMVDRR